MNPSLREKGARIPDVRKLQARPADAAQGERGADPEARADAKPQADDGVVGRADDRTQVEVARRGGQLHAGCDHVDDRLGRLGAARQAADPVGHPEQLGHLVKEHAVLVLLPYLANI